MLSSIHHYDFTMNGSHQSYLVAYKPFLRVLFLLGMCSFTIHSASGRARCSRTSTTYTITYLLLVLWLSIGVLYYLGEVTFTERSVLGFSDFIQMTISMIAHWILIGVSIHKRHEQVSFLNRIADVDELLQLPERTRKSQNARPDAIVNDADMLRKQTLMSLVCSFSSVLLMFVSDYLLEWPHDDEDESLDTTKFYYLSYLVNVATFLVMMHARCCALLLHVRLKYCSNHFESDLFDGPNQLTRKKCTVFMEMSEESLNFKDAFQRSFGTVVLITMAMDVLQIIVILFLCFHRVPFLLLAWKQLIFLFIGYVVCSYVKCFLLVNTLSKFGGETVSEGGFAL